MTSSPPNPAGRNSSDSHRYSQTPFISLGYRA